MYRYKKYFVILFVTVFVLGSLAATAMAYCGSGHDGSAMQNASGSTIHQKVSVADHGTDGTDKVARYNDFADEDSHSADCFNCDGSLCHSQAQSLVPVHLALGLYGFTAALHIDRDINHKFITLATIPQPPKQLS